ncbi:MAG: tetratricopeptide repeat protein [Alphaproteobacteria bacterium]|nr:tetratricopeptide repeat protein [Alphaproteobacteria bacterium]
MTDYYALGSFTWPITTAKADAQLWFDRGMSWCFGFNHEEAIACFEKALEHDPDCALARFGIAYAIGPNYNRPWVLFDPLAKEQALTRAFDECQAALALAEGLTPVEQALVEALQVRYPQRTPIEDQCGWDRAFADTMREVYRKHPDDLNVRSLFAEAVMNLTPWKMWDLASGEVAEGAGTAEVRDVLEGAMADLPAAWDHPGILHLYIHLMEMSPFPERALRAGDRLRELSPDSGHLIHMPTHLYVLCGHYADVLHWNQKAIVADRKYLEREGPMNFYSGYRIHNFHFAIYGGMFLGQYAPSLAAADELIATLPEALLRISSPPMADHLEAYLSMKQHVLVRFGRWQEIIDQPPPDDGDLYCCTVAMLHYAKSVAHSALGQIEQAEIEREHFLKAKTRVPETRLVHNNIVPNLLKIGEAMLEGELEYRKANYDAAFDHLRRSVALDDALPYDEPWGWMQPTRHALGALLLEQGEVEEAETVYRADLGLDGKLSRACQHPDNPWSLHGLHECLKRRGDKIEIRMIKQRLDLASARADIPITASCFCRMNRAA